MPKDSLTVFPFMTVETFAVGSREVDGGLGLAMVVRDSI